MRGKQICPLLYRSESIDYPLKKDLSSSRPTWPCCIVRQKQTPDFVSEVPSDRRYCFGALTIKALTGFPGSAGW